MSENRPRRVYAAAVAEIKSLIPGDMHLENDTLHARGADNSERNRGATCVNPFGRQKAPPFVC